MKRREFLLKSALMGTAAMIPAHKLFAAVQESPFKTVRRNVGTFTGRGGTIGWLVNSDATVAVDSQFPQSASNFIEGLNEGKVEEFDLLINTHHHGDHTAGNSAFKGKVKDIVAHENVPDLQKGRAEAQGQEALDAQVYANKTYSDKWKQDVGDETIHLTYYGRAHTKGDSVVYFEKANVAHMGDLVFNHAHPFIDRAGGASISNWASMLRKTTQDLPADAIYIFGHGNPAHGITGSKDDVIVKANFLDALLEYTQKEINAGKSKEEIAKATAVPGYEEFNLPNWIPLSRCLNTAYDEITED